MSEAERITKQLEEQIAEQQVEKPGTVSVDFAHLLHAFQQSEGRLKAMQAQAGSRPLPLHNVFTVVLDELRKLQRNGLPSPEPIKR